MFRYRFTFNSSASPYSSMTFPTRPLAFEAAARHYENNWDLFQGEVFGIVVKDFEENDNG